MLYLLVFFSGVLEVKYDLHRKIKIKMAKFACIGTWPQMHFLDLQQLDRWLNDCSKLLHPRIFLTKLDSPSWGRPSPVLKVKWIPYKRCGCLLPKMSMFEPNMVEFFGRPIYPLDSMVTVFSQNLLLESGWSGLHRILLNPSYFFGWKYCTGLPGLPYSTGCTFRDPPSLVPRRACGSTWLTTSGHFIPHHLTASGTGKKPHLSHQGELQGTNQLIIITTTRRKPTTITNLKIALYNPEFLNSSKGTTNRVPQPTTITNLKIALYNPEFLKPQQGYHKQPALKLQEYRFLNVTLCDDGSIQPIANSLRNIIHKFCFFPSAPVVCL